MQENDAAQALERALDDAFDALRNGRIDDLGPIYAMTETILTDLSITNAAVADRVRQKAQRNETLLAAAGRGVRAALRRLADIAPGATLTTYDATGTCRSLGKAPTDLTRRI